MQEFKSVADVLDFAIAEEAGAVAFYRELAAKVERPWMKDVLEGFAAEEQAHHDRLKAIKANGERLQPRGEVTDLKIADYLVDVDPDTELDYQQALVLAMKKEKSAFRLYSDLAEQTQAAEVKQALLALAQEEAKHKLRFEVEYDDMLSDMME